MKTRMLSEIMACINSGLSGDSLQDAISFVISQYEISAVTTEIIPYDVIPKEIGIYLVSRSTEGIAQSSIYQYRLVLEDFFSLVRKPVATVETLDIRKYLFAVQHGSDKRKGVSNRTLEMKRMILSTFFKWCVTNEYLQRNPAKTIAKIKYEKNRRKSMTHEELEEVRKSCKTIRDKCLVEFLYSTAMRVSEVVNCKITDIDIQNRRAHIYGEKNRKYRYVFLSEKCVYYLKQYIKERNPSCPYLFQNARLKQGRKITKSGAEAIIKRITENCSFSKVVTPHVFRHTFATHALSAGMSITDIQTILGHADPGTTMEYADINISDIQNRFIRAIA